MKYKVSNTTGAYRTFKGNHLKPYESIVIESQEELKSNEHIKIEVDKVLSNKGVNEKKKELKL